jgi:Leucine-rich repeat (LRR) protein
VALKQLQCLMLLDDYMTTVPEGISQLTCLSRLMLVNTHLVCLPSSMSTLVQLEQLALLAPQLQSLPEGITALTRLTSIRATGVVLDSQSPAVQTFLAARKAKGCALELAPDDST